MIHGRYLLGILIYLLFAGICKGKDCPSTCSTACTDADNGCSTCTPGYYGRKCQHPLQCVSGKGRDYHGTKNITESNLKCQIWNSQTPNEHPRTHLPENYCRNTNTDPKPWCYNGEGTEPRFESCSIPLCDDQCPSPVIHLFGDILNPPDDGFSVGVVLELLTGCGPGTIGEQTCLDNKKWTAASNCRVIPWCSKPTDKISNGNIPTSQEEYNYNASITIICVTGYETYGPSAIWCQADKTWSSIPNWDRVQCPLPSLNHESKIKNKANEYRYQDRIEIDCNFGYTVVGQKSLMCQHDKTWKPTAPTCSPVQCVLPSLTEGIVIKDSKTQYVYKDTVKVECDAGYTLIGSTIFRCEGDPKWNGTFPTCPRVQCPQPSLNPESKIQNKANEYRFQDVIEIDCNFGYNVVGQKSLVCQHDKTWKPTEPTCAPVECVLPTVTGVVIPDSKAQFVYKDIIKVECDAGYRLNGSTVFRCEGDRTWNGTFRTCIPLPCTIPAVPVGMSYISNVEKSYVYRDKLTVMCIYTGLNTDLFCMADQTWGTIPNCTEQETGKGNLSTSNSTAVVAVLGSLLFASILIIFIIGIVIFTKRKRTSKQKESTNVENEVGTYTDLNMTDVNSERGRGTSVYATVGPVYLNAAMDDLSTKFKLQDAMAYVCNKKSKKDYFKRQFKEFISGMRRSTSEASKNANKSKNIDKNIYPYDDNRVVLKTQKSDPNSSYINASYIKGLDGSSKYIAAQGPISTTVVDFWRMVWEQDVGKIVMLTNTQNCVKYWPNVDIKTVTHGDINVHLTSEDVYSDFTIRQLSVRKGRNNSRQISQFHFTAWPDQSVPKYASSVAEFRRKVADTPSSPGPLTVHCSDGIGRTGTFIALDMIIDEVKRSGEADVVSVVRHLRVQRVNMVQTEEQFAFLHDLLIEEHECDVFALTTSDFQKKYRELQSTNPRTKKKYLENVFDALQKTSPIFQEEHYVYVDPVINKNNLQGDAPDNVGARNLNAVYLPTHRDEHAFIVTQMPVPSTVTDFLNLVVEQEVPCVVMLNEFVDEECGVYWPQNGDCIHFGDHNSVKVLEETKRRAIRITKLKITSKKKTHVFTQVRVMNWSDEQNVPEDPSLFLRIMEFVDLLQRGESRQPVIIHCRNGADKCGLLCTTFDIIDRLKLERKVVIPHVIKQMRSRRPPIITNLVQFDFCYKVLSAYLQEC